MTRWKASGGIGEALPTADPLKRLHLIQERMNLAPELAASEGGSINIDELEAEFVQAAGPYGARKNISYTAWRELGVPAPILARAGISRSS